MQATKSRFGSFFLLIGIILCILFALSYEQQEPNETLLGLGVLFTGLGLALILREFKPGPPVERFRGIRTARARAAQRRKAREEKRKAKEAAKQAKKKK
jgi:hypothetical protein